MAVSPNVVPVKVQDPLGMVGGLPQEPATDVETYTCNQATCKVWLLLFVTQRVTNLT